MVLDYHIQLNFPDNLTIKDKINILYSGSVTIKSIIADEKKYIKYQKSLQNTYLMYADQLINIDNENLRILLWQQATHGTTAGSKPK